MYDLDFSLPFQIGMNIETITLLVNLCIPLVYFTNCVFMLIKLKGMDKDAPFYAFIRGLVYFFLFYGLGALYFVWFDFFYMDFTIPNPIDILFGTTTAPPDITMQYWKIGNLIQNVGLFLMILQLRKRVFQKKFYQTLPIIWIILGMTIMIAHIFIPMPLLSDIPYFWVEMNFLFCFTWSISLPLTYSYIWKNAAGKMKKYAFILFICFIMYGIAWGLRSRTAVYLASLMFGGLLPVFGIANPFTAQLLWLIRAVMIVINLSLVLYAYQKLLKEF